MEEKTSIRKIKREDFSDIKTIADQQLGVDYLSKHDFRLCLEDKNKIGFVAETDGVLSGFSLVEICNADEIRKMVLCEHYWFEKHFQHNYPIGVIKTIAVSGKYVNKGIGACLTEESIHELEKKSMSLMSICWQQGNETIFARMLNKNGFNLERKFEGYWEEDSLKKKYNCKLCGTPPCKCDMLVYFKRFNNE